MSHDTHDVIAYALFNVVGAIAIVEGGSGFDQTNLVVGRSGMTDLFEVYTYIDDGTATAKKITPAKFQEMVNAGKALRFVSKDIVIPQNIQMFTGARFWIMRGSLALEQYIVDEMTSRKMIKAPFVAVGKRGIGYIVDGRGDNRVGWAKRYRHEAFSAAWTSTHDQARSLHWGKQADHMARMSFCLEPSLTVFSVAMVVWTCNNVERADGYLMMAYKARGTNFRWQVEQYVDVLERARAAVLESPPEMPLEVVP